MKKKKSNLKINHVQYRGWGCSGGGVTLFITCEIETTWPTFGKYDTKGIMWDIHMWKKNKHEKFNQWIKRNIMQEKKKMSKWLEIKWIH